MRTLRRLSLWLALLFPLGAMAAEDLLDIYKLAEESDPQLKAAAAQYRAAQTVKDQARAGLLPNASASGDLSRRRLEDVPTDSVGYGTDQTYALSLTQPIYRRDRFIQLDRADDTIAQAEAQFSAAEQSLILRAAEGYFNVLSARAEVEFARSEKTATARQLEQAKKRFEVGMIAITDVHEAQAAYDAAVAQELAAENQVRNAREALREITGRYHTNLAALSERMPLMLPDPPDMEAWTKVALDQNLQLRAQEYAREAARKNVEIQRSGRYPTVDATAQHSYSDRQNVFGAFSIEQHDTSVGVQLQWPFYQGGLVGARTKEAAEQYNQAKQNVDIQRRTTLRQTRDAYRGVDTGISRVKALKQAIVSAESALEATEAGFEVGTRTIVDVLVAQRNLFRAERDHSQSKYEYIVNTLRLRQAAGTLSPNDIKQVNTWLQQVEQ